MVHLEITNLDGVKESDHLTENLIAILVLATT